MKNNAFYIQDLTLCGGTERASILLANGLVDYCNVFIICTNREGELPFFKIDSRIKIIFLNTPNYKKECLFLIIKFFKALKNNRIDNITAVEVHSLLFVYPAYLLAKLFKKELKLIAWEHFNFTVNLGKRTRDYFRVLAARKAKHIVVLTNKDVELWSNNLNIKANILSINNPASFNVTTENYKKESRYIISVGRLTSQKGFDKLINIWEKFIKRLDSSDYWVLRIIGSGEDEDLLKQMIKEKKLCNSIEMISNTDKISEYYESASLYVMTSRFEGLPMVLIEAQSFGLPIVAYDCLTGPAEIVSNNTGFLIENDNTESFVEKLCDLVNNENLRIKMSNNAKKEVLKYSITEVAKKWNNILN